MPVREPFRATPPRDCVRVLFALLFRKKDVATTAEKGMSPWCGHLERINEGKQERYANIVPTCKSIVSAYPSGLPSGLPGYPSAYPSEFRKGISKKAVSVSVPAVARVVSPTFALLQPCLTFPLRLGVTYEKGVTLGNVTMSHRTRERPAECLASLSHSTMIGLPRAQH
ncbi:hypothetical protein EVAR_97674_1 [Eumeta japonica]|uniref:Uncharacterized protein n=1 Tax=Eumeta variegata TaxID=151549 RepID=A0A4C1WX69_EUMVA|nr:hypothetical protein EVAR_97674_1 [Eumeta japonica]